MARTEKYEIEVERPKGVSVSEMRQYIKTAVGQWAHIGDPEAPIWGIKVVWVTKITRPIGERNERSYTKV